MFDKLFAVCLLVNDFEKSFSFNGGVHLEGVIG